MGNARGSSTAAVRHESRALVVSGGVAAASAALVWLWLALARTVVLPLAGMWSIGTLTGVFAGAGGIVAIVLGRLAGPALPLRATGRFGRIRGIVAEGAIGFTVFAIVELGVIAAFAVLQRAFVGLELGRLPIILIVAVLAGIVAYATYLGMANLDVSLLAGLVTVFLIAGAFTSMLTAQDPRWWEVNFSALGMGASVSSLAFNLTLIVAGVVVAVLADYLTVDLETWAQARPRRWRVGTVRTLIQVLGALFAGVGLVPVDVSLIVHNTVAMSMALVFFGLVVAVPWLLPGFPRAFLVFGWAGGAVVVLSVVLFAAGIVNLTAMELVAAGIVYGWLIVFIRTGTAVRDGADAAVPAQATA